METKQTIFNIGMILTMIAGFTYFGLTDEAGMPLKDPTHYCNSTEEKAYCFDIRDYGDRADFRCLYNDDNLRTYFSCSGGWEEIPDMPIPVPIVREAHPYLEEVCSPPPISNCSEK